MFPWKKSVTITAPKDMHNSVLNEPKSAKVKERGAV